MKLRTPLDLTGLKITGLADPSVATDAVNLQYLQAFVRGLTWKNPAVAASTADVSLAAPGTSLDGVTLVTGDRVLLKAQTVAAENGVYVWTGSAAALTRATDLDEATDLLGAVLTVLGGTTTGNTVWVQTVDTITVGTTGISWSPVGGSQAAYTAGNGLALSGGEFSVVAGNGLIVDGTGVRVDPSVVSRKYSINASAASTTTVTHNLGTLDVTPTFREIATGEIVGADYKVVDANSGTATFAIAPAAGEIRITVQG